MGVGVSSLRLRKALVIRAYNLRQDDETLDEQFRKLCYCSNQDENGHGDLFLNLDDVKEYLGFGSETSGTTFDRLLGGSLQGQRISYKAFVDFLETGSTPSLGLPNSPDPAGTDENMENLNFSNNETSRNSNSGAMLNGNSPRSSNSSTTSSKRIAKGSAINSSNSSSGNKAPGSKLRAKFPPTRGAEPPSPPHDGSSPAPASTVGSQKTGGISRTAAALAFARTMADADFQAECEVDAEAACQGDVNDDGDNEGASSEGSRAPLSRQSSSLDLILSQNPVLLQRVNSSNVWQKREVVTQERTVHYTTIDADGVLQELIEKETSQTEVLHMESRDTGVFAHRETMLYDQTEVFNDQLVGEQHGQEEYVHLRSEADEFEYMDSTMPEGKGRNSGAAAQQQGEQSLSPRAKVPEDIVEEREDTQFEYDSSYSPDPSPTPSDPLAHTRRGMSSPGGLGLNLHLDLDPLTRATEADFAAPVPPRVNIQVDPSTMDEEMRDAYYAYLRTAQTYDTEEIPFAEEGIRGQRDPDSPPAAPRGGRRSTAAEQDEGIRFYDGANEYNDEEEGEFVGVNAASEAALAAMRAAATQEHHSIEAKDFGDID